MTKAAKNAPGPLTDAYRLIQSGTVVARVEGEHALREIMAHATVHRQDGPLSIQRRVKKRWRGFGSVGA